MSHHIEGSVSAGWISLWMTRSRRLPNFVAKENFYNTSCDSCTQLPAGKGREGREKSFRQVFLFHCRGCWSFPADWSEVNEELCLTSQSWASSRCSWNPWISGEWDAGEMLRISLSFPQIHEPHQWGFLFPLYGLFPSCMNSTGPGKNIHSYLCLLDVISWD